MPRCGSNSSSGINKISQQHSFISSRPFTIDANISRSELHGRNAGFSQYIPVTDIAQPAVTADLRLTACCLAETFRKAANQWMITRGFHRRLIPPVFRPAGRKREHVRKSGVIGLYPLKQTLKILAYRGKSLSWYCANLKCHLTITAGHIRPHRWKIIMILGDGIDCQRGETWQFRVRLECKPRILGDGSQARTDPPQYLRLLLDRIPVCGSRVIRVTEK